MTRSKSFRPLAGLWELIIENGKLKIMGYFTLSIFNFQFELSPCGVWVVSYLEDRMNRMFDVSVPLRGVGCVRNLEGA